MHISDQVIQLLLNNGWTEKEKDHVFEKHISNYEEAGTVSDGSRLVTLALCERSRYLSRVDGWGAVQEDVDLRDYPAEPAKAISAVMSR